MDAQEFPTQYTEDEARALIGRRVRLLRDWYGRRQGIHGTVTLALQRSYPNVAWQIGVTWDAQPPTRMAREYVAGDGRPRSLKAGATPIADQFERWETQQVLRFEEPEPEAP